MNFVCLSATCMLLSKGNLREPHQWRAQGVQLSPLSCKEEFFWLIAYVWNLVSDIAGGKETEGVWEQGVEENIWT